MSNDHLFPEQEYIKCGKDIHLVYAIFFINQVFKK